MRGGSYDGELTATRHADGPTVIDHADPRITVTGEFLYDVAAGHLPPATLTPADEPPPGCWPANFNKAPGWENRSPIGAILRIEGSDRTVVYRIVGYDFPPDLYYAEWPD